jgi:hypothetical protein
MPAHSRMEVVNDMIALRPFPTLPPHHVPRGHPSCLPLLDHWNPIQSRGSLMHGGGEEGLPERPAP